MEYLKENYKELLAMGLVTAYWAGIYYYLQSEKKNEKQNSSKPNSPQKSQQEEIKKNTEQKPKTYQVIIPELKPDPTAQEIAASIRNKINPQQLSFEAIVLITEKSVELIKSQYIQKSFENRKARRPYLHKNPYQYYRYVIEYNQEIELLLQQANDMLLQELGISKPFFEQQLTQLLQTEETIQQIVMLQQQLRQKLKLFLATDESKMVTIEQLKTVMIFQVQCLHKWKDLICDGVKRVLKAGTDEETNQLVNLVINTVLADLIWEQYELEEENLANEEINQYVMQDFELQQALVAMQQESAKLLQECYQNQ